jgi:hypothetical protein
LAGGLATNESLIVLGRVGSLTGNETGKNHNPK